MLNNKVSFDRSSLYAQYPEIANDPTLRASVDALIDEGEKVKPFALNMYQEDFYRNIAQFCDRLQAVFGNALYVNRTQLVGELFVAKYHMMETVRKFAQSDETREKVSQQFGVLQADIHGSINEINHKMEDVNRFTDQVNHAIGKSVAKGAVGVGLRAGEKSLNLVAENNLINRATNISLVGKTSKVASSRVMKNVTPQVGKSGFWEEVSYGFERTVMGENYPGLRFAMANEGNNGIEEEEIRFYPRKRPAHLEDFFIIESLSHMTGDTIRAIETNISIAQDIVEHTQNVVKISTNFFNKSEEFRKLSRADKVEYCKQIKKEYTVFSKQIKQQFVGPNPNLGRQCARIITFATLEKLEQEIQKTAMGNCGVTTFIALRYAQKKKLPMPVEAFHIAGGDHVILVIDRDQTSAPGDYEKWGKKAMVIDTWDQTYYPTTLIPSRLKNYIGTTSEFETLTEPFDPSKHQLECLEYVGVPDDDDKDLNSFLIGPGEDW